MAERGGLAAIAPDVRRLRRLSLVALPFALAGALAAHSWETALEWWRTGDLFEQTVARGEAVPYGGADWRLLAITRVADRPDGSAVLLAELEAVVRDPEAVSQLPCVIAAGDGQGRRWSPGFLPPSELRKLQRKTAVPETCGSVMLAKPPAGARIEVAESFVVPAASVGAVRPLLSLPAGRPYYLRFE